MRQKICVYVYVFVGRKITESISKSVFLRKNNEMHLFFETFQSHVANCVTVIFAYLFCFLVNDELWGFTEMSQDTTWRCWVSLQTISHFYFIIIYFKYPFNIFDLSEEIMVE